MKEKAELKEILPQLDKEQLEQVRLGMKSGVDTHVYLDPKYMPLQMQWIRLGLEANLDVSYYASPSFDWFQMEEIYKGLEAGIDVSKYASVEVTYDRMRQIRKGLEAGIDLSPFKKYGAPELREMRLALMNKVHIISYIIEGYDAEQLREIREALVDKIDITPYLSKEIRGIALHEISLGVRKHLNVEEYAKTYYSWQQMREIREGLEERLDVSQYINVLYSASQMHEIRLGLAAGLDVSEYRSLMFTAKDMKRKRMAIIQKLTADGNRQMVPGEDGYHEFLFDTKKSGTLIESKIDGIDFNASYQYVLCKEGDVIAIYHPATRGTDGLSSDGSVIKAKKGTEKRILFGQGISYSDADKKYTATQSGWIFLNEEENRMEVRPVTTLDSVKAQRTTLKLKGTVEVLGNVKSGSNIEVDGDLFIDGHVENAVIVCTGNLIVRDGINGGGKASVSAGKDLICKYFENCSASATGDVKTDYIFNSQVFSDHKIIANGVKGSIISSDVFAVLGIVCKQAGSGSFLPSNLTLDLPTEMLLEIEELHSDKKKMSKEMELLEQALQKYKDAYAPEERNANPAFLKVEKAIFTYKMELNRIETRLDEFRDLREEMERSRIVIERSAFENVTLKIAGVSHSIEDLEYDIRVSKSGDKLLVKH